MKNENRQRSESVLDLALDVIPSRAETRVVVHPVAEHQSATGRLSSRVSQHETAGWELMRDPVYEH